MKYQVFKINHAVPWHRFSNRSQVTGETVMKVDFLLNKVPSRGIECALSEDRRSFWEMVGRISAYKQRNVKVPNLFTWFCPCKHRKRELAKYCPLASTFYLTCHMQKWELDGIGEWQWHRLRYQTVSHGLIRLPPKRLIELSHCDCCLDTSTFVVDKMTEACGDSPAAWSGLSAVCCRGCI